MNLVLLKGNTAAGNCNSYVKQINIYLDLETPITDNKSPKSKLIQKGWNIDEFFSLLFLVPNKTTVYPG